MAEIVVKFLQQMLMNNGQVDDEERWLKHYSSNHQILLVGDGDFSFSLSLALALDTASNIVASSLDSYEDLMKNYKRAKTTLQTLATMGAQLLHGVDATKMKFHTDLRMRKFDRIIFNFPHAGFLGKEDNPNVIKKHRKLVRGFFRNASGMLRPNGEVHVSHKTTGPFSLWKIEELAAQCCLALLERVEFKLEDYPGYSNKRGDCSRPDEPFPLGKSSTFKFVLSCTANKPTNIHYVHRQQPQAIPLQTVNMSMAMDPAPVRDHYRCRLIFREYFHHALLTNGRADDNLAYSVREALRIGHERYEAEKHGKPLNDYISILEDLQNLSKQRVAYLQNRLREIGEPSLVVGSGSTPGNLDFEQQ